MTHIKVHDLKIESQYFLQVSLGNKTAELRKNDRDFKAGELIRLNDPNNIGYYLMVIITDVCDYPPALKNGYVMLSFKLITTFPKHFLSADPLIQEQPPNE
jgi:ParB family chromosome partitioning protein